MTTATQNDAVISADVKYVPKPGQSRCLRCGLVGYDIAPVKGRRRADGSSGRSQYCRWCLRDPEFIADRLAARRASARESMRRSRAHRLPAIAQRMAGAVLGPARCRVCKVAVWWTGWEWQNSRGKRHAHRRLLSANRDEGPSAAQSGAPESAPRYNDRDGSGVDNRIASRVDTRVSATTRGAGVVRHPR